MNDFKATLHLYKFTIQPCVKYFCHAWAGAPSCYLDMLYKVRNGLEGLMDLHLLPLMNS